MIIMAGYGIVLQIERLKTELDKLGFMMCYSKHGSSSSYHETVAIRPKDSDALPIYSRDAELFAGSLDNLDRWIQGVKWARDYDRMLKVSDDKKRARKEQDLRNYHLAQMLKDEKGTKIG